LTVNQQAARFHPAGTSASGRSLERNILGITYQAGGIVQASLDILSINMRIILLIRSGDSAVDGPN